MTVEMKLLIDDQFLQLILFFFSSRRRHTRLQGDRSSDVCSSDLAGYGGQLAYGTPPGAYPVTVEADYPAGGIARWRPFLHGLMAIPHFFALFFVWFGAIFAYYEIGRASCRESV